MKNVWMRTTRTFSASTFTEKTLMMNILLTILTTRKKSRKSLKWRTLHKRTLLMWSSNWQATKKFKLPAKQRGKLLRENATSFGLWRSIHVEVNTSWRHLGWVIFYFAPTVRIYLRCDRIPKYPKRGLSYSEIIHSKIAQINRSGHHHRESQPPI